MINEFYMPVKQLFGIGAFAKLGKEASLLGKNALLVSGRSSMRKLGFLDKAVKDLEASGVKAVIFDGIEQNPRSTTIDKGAEIARKEGIDLIIALGGGSVMDASKGIALASRHGKPVWNYVKTGKYPNSPSINLLVVPTVAASGSESNPGAVITNPETKEKMVLGGPFTYPQLAIIDPEFTLHLSERVTAQGGVDVFCHLVEPYLTAEKPSKFYDDYTEMLLRSVTETLPQILKNPSDIALRENLSWASTIACSALSSLGGQNGSRTLHAIEHPLSGYYDIAHADGLAALLPAWMEHLQPVRKERIKKLGEKVFGRSDGVEAVREWLKSVKMDLRLMQLGVEQGKLLEIADKTKAMSPWVASHPRTLDSSGVFSIFEKSFKFRVFFLIYS